MWKGTSPQTTHGEDDDLAFFFFDSSTSKGDEARLEGPATGASTCTLEGRSSRLLFILSSAPADAGAFSTRWIGWPAIREICPRFCNVSSMAMIALRLSSDREMLMKVWRRKMKVHIPDVPTVRLLRVE